MIQDISRRFLLKLIAFLGLTPITKGLSCYQDEFKITKAAGANIKLYTTKENIPVIVSTPMYFPCKGDDQ